MIVAHCNSLRGIVKHIDRLGTNEIQKIGIPNAIPLVYKFDSEMRPIRQENAISPLSGVFLEKKEVLKQALLKEEQHAASVGGVDKYKLDKPSFFNASSPTLTNPGGEACVISIDKASSSPALQQRKLLHLFSEHNLINNNQAIATHGRLALQGVKCGPDEHYKEQVQKYGRGNYNSSADDGAQYEEEEEIEYEDEQLDLSMSKSHTEHYSKQISSDSTNNGFPSSDYRAGFTAAELQGPLLIIIRHGKTEHNKLGLFTGWEDAPLANEGRDEAYRAGQLLLRHRIKVDYVYTSWLSRAIETAWAVVNELDILWVPIVKTWRLNEVSAY
jgi:2,3-bisphosphoglycerate-dependent phosphoglycerate mutase